MEGRALHASVLWSRRGAKRSHRRCRGKDYEALKERFAQRMLNEGLFRFYPHLKDKVAHYEVGTPLSTQHYIQVISTCTWWWWC